MIDVKDIALLLAAGGGILGPVLNFLSLRQQAATHKLVNGMSTAKEKADTAVGYAEGQEAAIKLGLTEPHPSRPPGKGKRGKP